MMSQKPPALLLIALAGLASGCAMHREVQVDSNPPGADVYAASTLLGTTPLVTDMNTLFPSRAFEFDRSAQRTLVLKKDGYADAFVGLTEWSAPRVIDVNLQPVDAGTHRSAESRLQELNRIYTQGLMTGTEYSDKKQAILADL